MINTETESNACNADNSQFKKKIDFRLDGTPYLNSSWKDSFSISLSVANEQFKEMCEKTYSAGSPCGKSKLDKIYIALKKFFIILKGVKKYYDKYVNGAINALTNLSGEIEATITVIASALKSLIQRIREWVMKKIRRGIEDFLNSTLPPLLKQIKKGVLKKLIDEVFCKFDDVIASLFKIVAEFLYSLVGQVINTPLCALENFVNALLNKIVNDIDTALGPIFDKLNQALGGVVRIAGSVFQAIDFILGFEGFLCEKPNCNDELKSFSAQGWGGPQNSKTDNWSKFSFGQSGIKSTTEQWMNDFFGPRDEDYLSPGGCYSGTFKCGIPQIQIFGGGGSGAVAGAVINSIGQVIGANLFYGGSGYTSTPFVSIVDPGDCGRNASAYAILSDPGNDGKSTIEKIIITNVGTGYSDTYNGGPPVINYFSGTPNPIILNQSISLSWNVSNATNVSLNIPGYTDLGLDQSIYLPITNNDVSFPAGKTEAIKTYTLTATNKNSNSESQVIFKNLDITVISSGVEDNNLNNTINQPPIIDSFTSNTSSTTIGGLINLSWKTSNTTNVSLDVSNYNSLPADGVVSLTIPLDYPIPSSGVALTSYTLTAFNENAPIGNQTATSKISISIVPLSAAGITPETTTGTIPGITPGETTGTTTGITPGETTGTTTGETTGTTIGTISGTTGGTTTGTNTETTNILPNQNSSNGNPIDAVSELDDVIVIDTGTGYQPTDTVSIIGGNNGADLSLNVTPTGQIVSININSPGYGFVTIPEIAINSDTGVGAKFRSSLKFTPLNQFKNQRQIQSINPQKLVKVIDCVSR